MEDWFEPVHTIRTSLSSTLIQIFCLLLFNLVAKNYWVEKYGKSICPLLLPHPSYAFAWSFYIFCPIWINLDIEDWVGVGIDVPYPDAGILVIKQRYGRTSLPPAKRAWRDSSGVMYEGVVQSRQTVG